MVYCNFSQSSGLEEPDVPAAQVISALDSQFPLTTRGIKFQTNLLRKQLGMSASLRAFLYWAFTSGHIREQSSASEVYAACASVCGAAATRGSTLPSAFLDLLVDGAHDLMLNAWGVLRHKMFVEMDSAAYAEALQAETEAAAARRKAEAEAAAQERLANTTEQVKRVSDALVQKKARHPLRAFDLQQLLTQENSHGNEHEAAVWSQFQWTKELTEALWGGVSSYEDWLKGMTYLGNKGDKDEALVELLDRFENEFHTLGWKKHTPGDFIGSRMQAKDDRSSEWIDIEQHELADQVGPVRVIAQYDTGSGQTRGKKVKEQFVALLVQAPVVLPDEQQEGKLISSHLRMGKRHSSDDEVVHFQGHPVPYVHMALTLPRLHMLHRLAPCIEDAHRGLQMTGVHGAGKSAMLRALVGILAVGGPSNIMYSSKSGELLDMTEESVFGTALAGSGHLARDLWTGTVTGQATAFRGMWEYFWLNESTLTAQKRSEKLFNTIPGQTVDGELNVVILDEVNELLKAIQYCQEASPSSPVTRDFWHYWLEWRIYGLRNSFRILAASPNGRREFVAGDGLQDVLFQLRPTRADHMAAVMHVAPQYLGGTEGTPLLSAEMCLHICEQLGGNARYISFVLSELKSPDRGVVRSSVKEHLDEMTDELSSRFTDFFKSEGSRKLSTGFDFGLGRLSSPFHLAAKDASMVVTREADRLKDDAIAGYPALLALLRCASSGKYDWTENLLHKLRQDDLEAAMVLPLAAGASSKGRRLLHTCTSASALKAAPRMGAEDLNRAVKAITHYGVSSYDATADDVSTPRESNSSARRKVLSGAIVLPVQRLLQRSTLSSDEGIRQPLHKRIVIQTVDDFPGVGFVCVERYENEVNVALYEVTKSTLKDHAKGKKRAFTVLRSVSVDEEHGGDDSSGGEHGGKPARQKAKHSGECTVYPRLRDVLQTCVATSHSAKLSTKGTAVRLKKPTKPRLPVVSWDDLVAKKLAAPAERLSEDVLRDARCEDSISQGTSTVNVLLATLGIPLVVKRSLVRYSETTKVKVRNKNKGPGGDKIEQQEREQTNVRHRLYLRTEEDDSLCKELHGDDWKNADEQLTYSFQMVYVSDTPMKSNMSEDYADLDADCVYGMFGEDLLF